jgi:hypothetical protein
MFGNRVKYLYSKSGKVLRGIMNLGDRELAMFFCKKNAAAKTFAKAGSPREKVVFKHCISHRKF